MAELSARTNRKGDDQANRNGNTSVYISNECESLQILIGDERRSSDSGVKEWVKLYSGHKPSNCLSRKRQIEKVPPLFRRDGHNMQDFDPMVVSLGPYHHGKPELRLAEKFKPVILPKFVSGSGKQIDDFYNKVLEVIDDARSCYVEGSTNDYNDEEFAQMMLLDGCFLLYYIECMAHQKLELWEFVDHLGMLASKHLVSEVFLLENQLPFQVLEVLISLKFREGELKRMINAFFDIMFAGRPQPQNQNIAAVEDEKQPLHLLEVFRARILFVHDEDKHSLLTEESQLEKERKEVPICVVKVYKQSFRPVTELKAKGIQFKRSSTVSLRDIKFKSNYLYGELQLPTRVINPQTSDEDVVKMYREIPAYDLQKFDIYDEVIQSIHNHYSSKMKTWISELIHIHFSSPWTVVAFLAATFLLILGFLQTTFTISSPPHK